MSELNQENDKAMKDYLDLDYDENENVATKETIKVRKVIEINSLDSLATHFKRDLSKMSLEELTEPNLSLKTMMQRIKDLRPNRIILDHGTGSFIVVDLDIMIDSHLTIRGRKLLGSGSRLECMRLAQKQLAKEFPDKMDGIATEEVDDTFLKEFCQMHYNNPDQIRIITSKQ